MNTKTSRDSAASHSPTLAPLFSTDPVGAYAAAQARIAELEAALADICANYDRKGNTPEARRIQSARALLAKEGR